MHRFCRETEEVCTGAKRGGREVYTGAVGRQGRYAKVL